MALAVGHPRKSCLAFAVFGHPASNREGVVFMEVDAPFTPGRPNSGGTMLKYKFFENASPVVIIARI